MILKCVLFRVFHPIDVYLLLDYQCKLRVRQLIISKSLLPTMILKNGDYVEYFESPKVLHYRSLDFY